MLRPKLGWLPLILAGGLAIAAAGQSGGDSSRDELYQQLAEEAAHLERESSFLKKVVRVVLPAVVHIDASKVEDSEVGRRSVEEAGAGVIFGQDGRQFILTNRHVIKDAPLRQIKITLSDGRIIFPSKVWDDSETDVAVMRVEGEGLVSARFGDSEQMEVGDYVIAIGSPFGLRHSVTYGVLSAKGRRDLQLGREGVRYQDFLQTDAAINPGNSGGPLLNLRGEVIGMNTAIASTSGINEGIGFAIPANMATYVGRQLLTNGRVIRGYLGVRLDSSYGPEDAMALNLTRPMGTRVSGITPDTPAQEAGLKIGDVILSFDGMAIENDAHLVNVVALTPVGKTVTAVIYRDRRNYTLNVKLRERE